MPSKLYRLIWRYRMHKYNEIIGLSDAYSPYYDLRYEEDQSWRKFIVTDGFYRLLKKTISALSKGNLSLWLQGTYGTGKSHATGFLKHLLWLDIDEVKSISSSFTDLSTKSELIAFREKNKVFPVVMYGAQNIGDEFDFKLQIELKVREAFEKAGIEFYTKTDFESYVYRIETERSNFWDVLIKEEYELQELVKDKQDMITKLKNFDQDLIKVLKNILHKKSSPVMVIDIVDWLKDVTDYLIKNNIATHMVIYWDEFTAMLKKNHSGIDSDIQRIVEASSQTNCFLYLISHRTVMQSTMEEDRKKLAGRFENANYEFSEITTYLILANAIQKLNYTKWAELRDENSHYLNDTIKAIEELGDSGNKGDLQNLFPIHPYTAHIATSIARVIGSTERSIFNFLNNKENGFAFFIENYPGDDKKYFLTADYLFDFFIDDFNEQQDSFYNSVVQRFMNNKNALQKENESYLSLMKVLLAINIANYISNQDEDNNPIVFPNKENMKLALTGTDLYQYIDSFLEFLDENKIILKNYDNHYIVDTTSHDPQELKSWIEKNKTKYSDLEVVLKPEHVNLIKPIKTGNKRKDRTTIVVMDADHNKNQIIQRIGSKDFPNQGQLNVLLIVAKDNKSINRIKEEIPSIYESISIPICIMILDAVFDQKALDRYLDFMAKAYISESRHQDDDNKLNTKNANGIVREWISTVMRLSMVSWYVKNESNEIKSGVIAYANAGDIISREISQIVFHKSFDILHPRLSKETLWENKNVATLAKNYMDSTSLLELISATNSHLKRDSQEILKDKHENWIVNNDLKLITDDMDHPLYIASTELSKRFKKTGEFNFYDAFDFLFKPPYGYYGNHIFIPALAFMLREYESKLYFVKNGEPISRQSLADMMMSVFKSKYEGKSLANKQDYQVQMGSEEELKLVKSIQSIFRLSECHVLIDTKSKLAEWFKENLGMPIWLLLYSDELDEDEKFALSYLDSLVFSKNHEAHKLGKKEFSEVFNTLEKVKDSIRNSIRSIDKEQKSTILGKFIQENTTNVGDYYKKTHYDELMSFLNENLQTDPLYWEEVKVINQIMGWHSNITRSIIQQRSEMPSYGSNAVIIEEVAETEKKTVQERVISSIINYNGDLKTHLIKFILNKTDYLSVFLELIEEIADD